MSYIEDTEYAVKNLIALYMHEDGELAKLIASHISEDAKFKAYEWDFETSSLNEDFSEAYEMRAHAQMSEAYSEAHNEVVKFNPAVVSLQASIDAKDLASQVLCGALLQVAKQGISLIHGSLESCPEGRLVGGIPMKDIIWSGRIQAIHFEEPITSKLAIKTFKSLEDKFGTEFALSKHLGKSRARQVVMNLGWINYSAYCSDMIILGLK